MVHRHSGAGLSFEHRLSLSLSPTHSHTPSLSLTSRCKESDFSCERAWHCFGTAGHCMALLLPVPALLLLLQWCMAATWRVPESEVVHGGWVEKKLFHYIKGRQRTEASCYNGEGETDCAAISVRQYLTEKMFIWMKKKKRMSGSEKERERDSGSKD